MKKYTYHISGTHCPSCKILIEDILSEDSDIHDARVDIKTETLTLTTENKDEYVLANELTTTLQSHGYIVSKEKIE